MPTLLYWIQLWRVRWQILKQEPIRLDTLKVFLSRNMCRQAIKNDHHLLAIITTNHRQEKYHHLCVHRTIEHRETKLQSLLYWCHRYHTKCGLRLPRIAGKKTYTKVETADYLDSAFENFSDYIAVDEVYDGPFCILFISDGRTGTRLLFRVLNQDPNADATALALKKFPHNDIFA
ncbi:MAG: hypothetical protein FWE95_09420 [Planctomycetaceae bacterium]|nr:hypothetical protein [Planctomycetaceae bacterium]